MVIGGQTLMIHYGGGQTQKKRLQHWFTGPLPHSSPSLEMAVVGQVTGTTVAGAAAGAGACGGAGAGSGAGSAASGHSFSAASAWTPPAPKAYARQLGWTPLACLCRCLVPTMAVFLLHLQ